jgi:myosin heavy subunit
VLGQLRCSGVVEAVRVMQAAFPTRLGYEELHGRYAGVIGPEVAAETLGEPRAFSEAIALACGVSPDSYALGLSKLFLKAGSGAPAGWKRRPPPLRTAPRLPPGAI